MSSEERLGLLGLKEGISERSLYRALQKVGSEFPILLESSLDAEPQKILELYKQRDIAEKFIRGMKEGGELRHISHCDKYVIIGALFVCFLAAAMMNLTLNSYKNPYVKNFKLLKKYLEI